MRVFKDMLEFLNLIENQNKNLGGGACRKLAQQKKLGVNMEYPLILYQAYAGI